MGELVADFGKPRIINVDQLDNLLSVLGQDGRQVIGPVVRDGAIVYDPVSTAVDLPKGQHDIQEAGTYRLQKTDDPRYFAHVVGPQSWKKYLYPAKQTMWTATRTAKGFELAQCDPNESPEMVFLGVRACEIAAMSIQDKVFDNGDFADPGYLARRKKALIVAVNCTRAGGACFCTSMNGGPRAKAGYDLALTELVNDKSHLILIEIGSDRGAEIVQNLDTQLAQENHLALADDAIKVAKDNMGRQMPRNAHSILGKNLEHVRWDDVAERCLSCANCTMVCPTCFCTTTKDLTSLDGKTAERQREWDSCFTTDFSYIHGGSIRQDTSSRYRQWITHKLVHWHDQFDESGCTGCGRCITWCPVGIDITEEVRAIEET